ncbi:unnamed protein product [Lampetra fluviatilis]
MQTAAAVSSVAVFARPAARDNSRAGGRHRPPARPPAGVIIPHHHHHSPPAIDRGASWWNLLRWLRADTGDERYYPPQPNTRDALWPREDAKGGPAVGAARDAPGSIPGALHNLDQTPTRQRADDEDVRDRRIIHQAASSFGPEESDEPLSSSPQIVPAARNSSRR